MSKYRKVDSRIWNDAKFMQLSDNGKLVFFMLLTHPAMTALGAMRASSAGLAEEMGWSKEAFAKAFAEALSKGMAEHDQRACFMALPKFIHYNEPESPNVVKGWTKSLDLIPECQLKNSLMIRTYNYIQGKSQGFRKALHEDFAQALLNQEQEQEQEQEQDNNLLSRQKNLDENVKKSCALEIEINGDQHKQIDIPSSEVKKKKYKYTQDDLVTAEFIYKRVCDVMPKTKKPNFDKWSNEIRMLRENDGYDLTTICKVFSWANKDSFNKFVVKCPSKLRARFPELLAKSIDCKTQEKTPLTIETAVSDDWAAGFFNNLDSEKAQEKIVNPKEDNLELFDFSTSNHKGGVDIV